MQSKLNTVFLGVIAVSLLIIAIDTFRPRFMGFGSPEIRRMNVKSGEVEGWNFDEKKFVPYKPAQAKTAEIPVPEMPDTSIITK